MDLNPMTLDSVFEGESTDLVGGNPFPLWDLAAAIPILKAGGLGRRLQAREDAWPDTDGTPNISEYEGIFEGYHLGAGGTSSQALNLPNTYYGKTNRLIGAPHGCPVSRWASDIV